MPQVLDIRGKAGLRELQERMSQHRNPLSMDLVPSLEGKDAYDQLHDWLVSQSAAGVVMLADGSNLFLLPTPIATVPEKLIRAVIIK